MNEVPGRILTDGPVRTFFYGCRVGGDGVCLVSRHVKECDRTLVLRGRKCFDLTLPVPNYQFRRGGPQGGNLVDLIESLDSRPNPFRIGQSGRRPTYNLSLRGPVPSYSTRRRYLWTIRLFGSDLFSMTNACAPVTGQVPRSLRLGDLVVWWTSVWVVCG